MKWPFRELEKVRGAGAARVCVGFLLSALLKAVD